MVNFRPLVLGVLLNSSPDSVYHSTGVHKTLLKESLSSTKGKRALAAWFQRLYWCNEDKTTIVWLKLVVMTVYIKMIVKLLKGLFGGLLFQGN